mgnify:CR=1 FL=1
MSYSNSDDFFKAFDEKKESYFRQIIEENPENVDEDRKRTRDIMNNYESYLESLFEPTSLTVVQLKEVLKNKMQEKAEELSLEMENIAPFNDYSKLIEDNDGMAAFMKNEASNSENWKCVSFSKYNDFIIISRFSNKAIDNSDNIFGFVYFSIFGKIKYVHIKAENEISSKSDD